MKLKPKMIVILVIIALCLIILFQNTQVVTLRLFFWNVSMSQIIFMPLIFIIGFILGFLVSKWTGRRHSS
ncbi:MAG: LapA family protein [Deltaproteobacteria bacterium]|nr:LapA family protein [Deltaproteobacteria bacterium]